MPEEAVVAIARIPLARSRTRMLLAPAVLLLTAAVAAAAGIVVGDWQGLALVAAAGLLGLVAVYLVAVVASVRLDVEVSTLRLRWLGADRHYALVRGPVTRVALTGEGSARLRPRFGAFGWGLGPARLRGTERVQLVRLARTASVILIPTDAGRVAVAPLSEEQLIEALTAAARVQQRLDQVALRARAVPVERVVQEVPPEPAALEPDEPEPARVLTGIERVLLEKRLAAERAAAIAAAQAERRLAEEEAAALAAAATVPAGAAVESRQAPSARARADRPSWLRLPRPRVALPALGGVSRTRLTGYLVASVPLAVATGVWSFATLTGRLDLPEADQHVALLGLVLAGPAAALGALAGRAWFPRLLGLVTIASLCSLVLVARALVA